MSVSDRRPTSTASNWSGEDKMLFAGWISTLLLILFMLGVPLFSNGAAAWLAANMWFALLLYLFFQLLITAIRSEDKLGAWAMDNFVALVALGCGVLIMTREWFWLYSPGHWSVIKQCTMYGAADLGFGLLFSQVKAFAGKKRDEV